MFGESSDDNSDDDCTHNCRGHKHKCYQADHADGKSGNKTDYRIREFINTICIFWVIDKGHKTISQCMKLPCQMKYMYHWVFTTMSNTMGASSMSSGAGVAYPSGEPELTLVFVDFMLL